ncbi:MAG: ATP-dependent zinc protease [Gammaproteobacteria bacterium]|nr:ATP-dependent zinc protease [Gammaproteobacteria bacterium]
MSKKLIVGWKEWCALDALGLPAIKAKMDTGATTSAIHALYITPLSKTIKGKGSKEWVKFTVYPFKEHRQIHRECLLQVIDRRHVVSSDGGKELRYVVQTQLTIAQQVYNIELTLTNRAPMRFPMLLGREALEQFALVDAGKNYNQGKMSLAAARNLYI